MSAGWKCDITGECLDDTDTRNSSWTALENNNVTVMGVTGVKIAVEVNVDVFQDGRSCHISETAKQAINQIIKNYIQNL